MHCVTSLSSANPKCDKDHIDKVLFEIDSLVVWHFYFGAFVEIRPGLEGLLHISQLDTKRVQKVDDVVKEKEQVLVKIIDVDRQGKVKLSRKEALGQKPTH